MTLKQLPQFNQRWQSFTQKLCTICGNMNLLTTIKPAFVWGLINRGDLSRKGHAYEIPSEISIVGPGFLATMDKQAENYSSVGDKAK